jgi:ABC-2 type transport system permease protein
LTFAAIAFAVGAATGNRPAAAGAAAALAVAGYVLEGLAQQIPALRPARPLNPWHWLLASDPVRHGLILQSWLPPLIATAVLVAAGLPRLARRDLH